MIDLKTLANELHHARLARIEAQSAMQDVEDLIWQVQHFEPGRGRLCLFVESLDVDPAAARN
jgi:hypothetical protein